ncbi:uncharacterized protein F4817DRAFT_362297 [Daldinia loculata]|uniref:uncharacterized protein n=1 Tax=Daldinia loculata TaxID=103429 RepID=UPI0020C1FA02|nr:uncharacterized protein F4817DRAFT_362297 [Daldinia loculata]KAI1642398.1 hypothetical protein F4817DRAFT_362297 [Daldinia loculata]
MQLKKAGKGHQAVAMTVLVSAVLSGHTWAAPYTPQRDPFKVLDPQNWVNPDNMTWADYKTPPGTSWSDPSRKGSVRNFNIALVAVDYPDEPFVITQAPNSTVFGNPLPIVSSVNRTEVPAFYRDFLNKPSDLNHNHTLHEYWMEDSGGRFGVDLTAFGAYQLPSRSYQYGIDDERGGFNEGACPSEGPCSIDLRTDALGAWRADVGKDTADSFELVFILSAGQDESSTWQEFGEMKFLTPEDVPDEFGPPNDDSLPNYAATRYVNWTSWQAASVIWPNAGGGSSTQAESSGMSTYAHELTHLLGIGDNYNNPYSDPPRRAYTGPWSMLSRGSFNGPGGPHTRWQIPATLGGSLGSLHTVSDKLRINLADNSSVLTVSREALSSSGPVVAEITARCINPGEGELLGLHVILGKDLSPFCNVSTDALCDGGGYNNYDIEVIDRMGADSFTPDSGVMISKTKDVDNAPFQWTIDANPQDIDVIDFYRPDGTASKLTIGDYRQLADALFHAGTRSGSEYEYTDEANRLHFYIIDIRRDDVGILHYTVGVRSLDGSGSSTYSVDLSEGQIAEGPRARASVKGVTCAFHLTNSGIYVDGNATHPQDLSAYLNSDIYRLSAEVDSEGWHVEVPNALTTAKFGSSSTVNVAVGAAAEAADSAVVRLTATSESRTIMFGSSNTFDPNTDVPDLSGKVFVVTGGSAGIGYGISAHILQHGPAKLYLLGKKEEHLAEAEEDLKNYGDVSRVEFIKCELEDLRHTDEVARNLASKLDRLDALVLNAGLGVGKYNETKDALDSHMQVNVIAQHHLARVLLPKLIATRNSRLCFQSSEMHRMGTSGVEFRDVAEINQDIGPTKLYSRSKLAQVLLCRTFNRRKQRGELGLVPGMGPWINATHPGGVNTDQPNQALDAYGTVGSMLIQAVRPFMKEPAEEGCRPILFAATSDAVAEEKIDGQYIIPDRKVSDVSNQAKDEELQERCWRLVEGILKEKLGNLPYDTN